MIDRISSEHRSWNMSRIRGKNTKPEILLRQLLHRTGYRFRTHAPDLPGKPDIVLRRFQTVIFVNGCFWHRHEGCPGATTPKTRTDFWMKKFQGNIERDRQKQVDLESLGWQVLTVWECELKSAPLETLHTLEKRLISAV